MATFRVISSPKVGLICVVVFLVVYFLSLLNKYHRVDNNRLVTDSTYIYEPRGEKTGLRGIRPGPTQTGLYSHRRWLDA